MRLSLQSPADRGRVLRTILIVSVWVLTIVAAAYAGGSPAALAIFSLGAVSLYAVVSFHDGEVALRAQAAMEGRDHHTGLATPAYAQHFLHTEYAAAERGRAVTLVLFGFDQFDEFTAKHGRAAGDAAVREFGRILRDLTRRMNLSARYGWRADTFLSVLSNADAAGARVFVERVRGAVADAAHSVHLPPISAGIAEFDAGMTGPHEFVQRAEEALAAARLDTRDRLGVRLAVCGRKPVPRLRAV